MTWLIGGWLIALVCVLWMAVAVRGVSKDYDDDQRDGRP